MLFSSVKATIILARVPYRIVAPFGLNRARSVGAQIDENARFSRASRSHPVDNGPQETFTNDPLSLSSVFGKLDDGRRGGAPNGR